MATIKLVFEEEIRRIKIDPHSSSPFSLLAKIIDDVYGLKSFQIRYRDDENDLCLITSDDEMKEAIRIATAGKPLKLFLTKASTPESLVKPAPVPESLVKSAPVPESPVKPAPMQSSEPVRGTQELDTAAVEPEVKASVVKDIQEVASKPDSHQNIKCDTCGMFPIVGFRYKCTSCENFDLCASCESKNEHPMDHVLLKVKKPLSEDFKFVSPFPKWVFVDQRELSRQPVHPKAHFVRDVSVPDGSAWRPRQRVQKIWSMKNVGKTFWPRDTKVVFNGGQLTPVVDEDQPVVPLAAPGEVVDVSVKIQMPEKPGRYTGYYRLSTPDGLKFGHRIWIDVLVSDSAFHLTPVKEALGKAYEAVSKALKGSDSKPFESEKPKDMPKQETPVFPYEDELAKLKGMGFSDESQLKELLQFYKGDVQRVANRLVAS